MTIEIPKKEPLNIVPFIDIMLVLLAMVLSVSTFIAKGEIPIALPESRSAQAPLKNSNEVLIQVTGEGTLHWNGEEATHEAWSLMAALAGCEMGLKLAGVKLAGSAVQAAMEYFAGRPAPVV